ncbi:site-specific integrase, partial [Klebsiella pneumoniae]|uniref:site-specific integrase n=1 Tax=Klebsiella pneumoniae TaxID=573 RepID=UPI003AF31A5A
YSFSRSDVQQYLDDLTAQKKSSATINGHYAAIRSFSQFANKTECITDIRIVKAPNLYREAPVALERKEVLRIMREVDRSNNKRDKAILLTCHTTTSKADSRLRRRSSVARVRSPKTCATTVLRILSYA